MDISWYREHCSRN